LSGDRVNDSSSPTNDENKESLKKSKTPSKDKSQKMVYQKK
jgi:autotransporter adhesin